MEPKNHLIEKENHLNQTSIFRFHVNFPGLKIADHFCNSHHGSNVPPGYWRILCPSPAGRSLFFPKITVFGGASGGYATKVSQPTGDLHTVAAIANILTTQRNKFLLNMLWVCGFWLIPFPKTVFFLHNQYTKKQEVIASYNVESISIAKKHHVFILNTESLSYRSPLAGISCFHSGTTHWDSQRFSSWVTWKRAANFDVQSCDTKWPARLLVVHPGRLTWNISSWRFGGRSVFPF